MSRAVEILQAIQNSTAYSAEVQSRVEGILKSIANGTENLVNIADHTIVGGVADRYNITEAVRGKTISASCKIINNQSVGNGARVRIDITVGGENSIVSGNTILTGMSGISKIENTAIPADATIVYLTFQTFSNSVGEVDYSNIMVNEGATAADYIPYIENAQSRYEELLSAIKAGTPTTLTAQTRLESLLIAIANGTLDTWIVGKNLFNIRNLNTTNTRVSVKDETIYIDSIYFCSLNIQLKTLCPALKVGDTYVLNMVTTGRIGETVPNYIYLGGEVNAVMRANTAYVCTQAMLDAAVTLYGNDNAESYIKEFKIEIGSTVTPYTPYAFSSEIEEEFYKAFR